ncbi:MULTISPECIES: hypothetical protein [unclassified Flavobacterium]|uniref:hypothetical protein n=1 Tax=unclassified Flavobacterium TaxID=196869 RepID=UPI001F13C86D|nr:MULTISPECIES: hypothetical protein [unclassified Flavobacterium]UMY64678.1 hypothetical protein MKO97_09150 [Flavobacterium sp. HJ-32-4]
MLRDLFSVFSKLKALSKIEEGWSYLTFSGTWQNGGDFDLFSQIEKFSQSENLQFGITWQIDGNSTSYEEFKEDLVNGSLWQMNINKTSRLEYNRANFFYDLVTFNTWARALEPFDKTNPLLSAYPIRIYVNNLKHKIIASNYIICDPHLQLDFGAANGLPSFDEVNSSIHVVSRDNFTIEPAKLLVTDGECNDSTAPFFEMSAKALGACIVSEFVSRDSIILRGVRRIDLVFYKNITALNIDQLRQLKSAVIWIYEERTDLKLKLFLDRLTLDIDLNQDYISELLRLNRSCLEQAKERYAFITFERKDQYQKELRELLKDLKGISDLYTNKVRTLLSNLLRDVLAGLLLIGITILSKVENVISVTNSPVINLVFKAFAAYFLLSIIFQSVFDFLDISKAKDEFIYWKRTSREYISELEFRKYLKETVERRELFTYCYYGFLIMTYLALSIISYKFIDILKEALV